ncbi:MAG: hypothetical protein IJW63_10485 [Lachnospiraceae bacterium]|nr:hypothetical protein [Lachnospiraceae bacterium]
MKKNLKKLAGIAMSLILLANCGFQVNAASSVSGEIDGQAVSGYVTYNSTSATASTSYPRSNCTIYAHVTAYVDMGTYMHTDATSSTTYAGGASATATRSVNKDVVGGKGVHDVKYGAYTWHNETTSGTTN